MLFIGDVHGKFTDYEDIILKHRQTIQVGDFGLGFGGRETHPGLMFPEHRFIRGNHDNPTDAIMHPCSIADGTYTDGMMFIGGAWSIDWHRRIPGVSWWANEEVSHERFEMFIDNYEKLQPSIMVTHDAPHDIASELFRGSLLGGPNAKLSHTRTGMALNTMWNIHQPKLWVFGHYHMSRDVVVEGCRFICLAELETKEINLDEYR